MDDEGEVRHRQRRVAVLASAGVLLVAVVGVVVLRSSNASNPGAAVHPPSSAAPFGGHSSPPANASPVGVAALARYRWHTLPPAPITARSQAAGVWTGHDLLVWGGSTGTTSYADGASYDPAERTWTRLPAAPIAARSAPAFAWTGAELFVWGGVLADNRAATDGALYNPTTHRWTTLPPAPIGAYGWARAYVVGPNVIVLSTPSSETWRGLAATEYDVGSGTWRRLPSLSAPSGWRGYGANAVSTSQRLVVWLEDVKGYAPRVDSYSFDPRTRRWRAAPLTPRGAFVAAQPVWTGPELLDASESIICAPDCMAPYRAARSGTAWRLDDGTHTAIPHGPVTEYGATWLWTGAALLGVDSALASHGLAAAWNPTTGQWSGLARAPSWSSTAAVTVWTGTSVLLWGELRGGDGAAYGLEFSGP